MTERLEFGIRADSDLDPAAPLPPSDPRLVERMADEIRWHGPLTFARFMDLALYDPQAGYYTAGDDGAAAPPTGPGRRGDYLTAPEAHPIFGWALARQLEATWRRLDRPGRFVVREHGAGDGALAEGILDGLRRSGSPLLEAIRYQGIERSAGRQAALQQRLDRAGLASHLEPADDRPSAGAVIANELLDALPVHRVEGLADGAIAERFVVLDDDSPADAPRFVERPGPPSTPALAARLAAEGVILAPGQVAEICLAIDDWIAAAAAPLARGLLLVIDYGHPAEDLYAPARGSLLRAYHRHRVHADPFLAIGRQDLTTHVDVTAVERAARAVGLQPWPRIRQAAYLAELGIGDLLVALQAGAGASLEAYLAARSAVVRMLDPRASGAFAVMRFDREPGGPPDR